VCVQNRVIWLMANNNRKRQEAPNKTHDWKFNQS